MANGKAIIEELREIISEDKAKGLISKQFQRIALTVQIELYDKINGLDNKITCLEGKLDKEVPSKWIVRNWKSIALLGTLTFVVLHSLIPADVSVWTLFSKIIGGP